MNTKSGYEWGATHTGRQSRQGGYMDNLPDLTKESIGRFIVLTMSQTVPLSIPGMTGPPNSFTARGPVTLTAILFPQPAV